MSDIHETADNVLDALGIELEDAQPSWLDEEDDPDVLRDCLKRQRLAAAAERLSHEARALVADVHIDPDNPYHMRLVVGTPTGDRAHEREVGGRLLHSAISLAIMTTYQRNLVEALRGLREKVNAGEVEPAEAWRRVAYAMGDGEETSEEAGE